MNSFFHGLGGGIGRGIGRFIAILFITFVIYLIINFLGLDIKKDILNRILMLNVSAKQQTSTSFNIYTNYDSACGSGGVGYCAVTTNQTATRRSKGSTYSGVLEGIDFYISYVLNPRYQYSINIYAMSTDFRNNDLSVYVYGFNDNNPAGMQSLSYTYSFVSKSQITINLSGYYSWQNVAIYMTGNPLTGINTYGIRKVELVYDDGSTDMSGVIDNQNQNTNDIINNNNNNTEDVIDNQNQNTQSILDKMTDLSYPSCADGNRYFLIGSDKSYIANQVTGQVNINNYYYVSQPIKIRGGGSYTMDIVNATGIQYGYYCFYNNLNQRISCTKFSDNTTTSYTFTAPSNAVYFRTTLYRSNNVMLNATLKGYTCVPDTYESNVSEFHNFLATNVIGDLMNDDSVDQSQANSFFNDFEDNDHGLSSIITLPLSTIQSLTNQQCVTLRLPLPFTNNQYLDLPCMSQIYQQNVPDLYSMWQVVCYGLIGYWIATDIFRLIKGFKDPEQDKVEVLDL